MKTYIIKKGTAEAGINPKIVKSFYTIREVTEENGEYREGTVGEVLVQKVYGNEPTIRWYGHTSSIAEAEALADALSQAIADARIDEVVDKEGK